MDLMVITSPLKAEIYKEFCYTQMNLSMRQKQNHGHREQTGCCQGGGGGGRAGVGGWG